MIKVSERDLCDMSYLFFLFYEGWTFHVETLHDCVMHRVSLYFRSQTFYPPSARHPLFQSLSADETQRGL